jgi:hypothetical protein
MVHLCIRLTSDATLCTHSLVVLCVLHAGWLSPVCLGVVAGILYLYRFIYGEAISALPMNGGSYNVVSTASYWRQTLLLLSL